MAQIHTDILDAALNHTPSKITSSAHTLVAEVRNAASSVLVASIALDASNFGAAAVWSSASSTGRSMTHLVSSASDMKNISVNSAGTAAKVVIKDTNDVNKELVVASLSGTVSLGTSDQINLGTFDMIFKQP